MDHESIFERMARSGSVRSAVVDHGNPAILHGAKANTTVACKTDEEVLEGLLQVVHGHQFTFGRFMGLADVLGCEQLQ
jgi:RNA exonuclease 1